ncbi:hypothetical protein Tco_0503897 [Tanacetum coccineum]
MLDYESRGLQTELYVVDHQGLTKLGSHECHSTYVISLSLSPSRSCIGIFDCLHFPCHLHLFNDLLRACPHHRFSELHQLDTFYNALNSNDQDSLNSAAGGNFLDKMPRDCLRIIESKSKVRNSHNKPVVAKVSSSTSTPGISSEVAELKDMVKAFILE